MPKRAPRPLTAKQQTFLDHLLANGGNASEAYRIAYPAVRDKIKVSSAASRLRSHPLVKEAMARAAAVSLAAVDRAVARYEITADAVAEELACLAMTRISQLADVRTELVDGKRRQIVVVRDFADVEDRALAAVCEVKRAPGGDVTVKLYDKRAALMDIARLKGYIKDTPPPTGNVVMFKVER